MRQQRHIFQRKEQNKTPEEELGKGKISNLPKKEFKIIIIKMLNKLRGSMDEHSENFNKEFKDIEKN